MQLPRRGQDDGFFGARPDQSDPIPSGTADGDGTGGGLPSVAKGVIACAIVTVLIASAVVGIRIYCRAVVLRGMKRDDWIIIFALICSIGNSTGMILQAITALGRHMHDLPASQIELWLKEAYATIILYNGGLYSVKISILLLYLRLFGATHPAIYKLTCCFLGFVVVAGLWTILSAAFFCWPVSTSWDISSKGSCLPREPRWFAGVALNIVTDFMIFVLPLPIIFKMRLPRPQKIGLMVAFALGFFVCFVSVLRLRYIILAVDSVDPTWDNPALAKWSVIELNVAIICPCIATLKPLTARLFSSLPEMLHRDARGEHHVVHARSDRELTMSSGGRPWYRITSLQKTGTATTAPSCSDKGGSTTRTSSLGGKGEEIDVELAGGQASANAAPATAALAAGSSRGELQGN